MCSVDKLDKVNKYHFSISWHAAKRFRDYIFKDRDIEEILWRAKPADDMTTMEINSEYATFTGKPKNLSNKSHVYFVYDNVVFACIRNGLKNYFVQTCWLRNKYEEVTKESECDSAGKDIVDYLQSSTTFDIKEIYELSKKEYFPKHIRQFLKKVKRRLPNITREEFIEKIDNFEFYQKALDEKNNPYNWQRGIGEKLSCQTTCSS